MPRIFQTPNTYGLPGAGGIRPSESAEVADNFRNGWRYNLPGGLWRDPEQ